MFSYINKRRLLCAACAFTMAFGVNIFASDEISKEAEAGIAAEAQQAEDTINTGFIEQMKYTLGSEEVIIEEIQDSANINISYSARNNNEAFTSKLFLNDENLSVYLSQWKNNDTKPKKIEIKNTDGYYSINLFNNISGNDAGYAELTFQPKNPDNGEPVTYVFRQVLESGMGQHPFIQNIYLTTDNTDHCEEYHGKLIAVDNKFENTLNLGYGFLATRTNYIVYVPWSVNSIDISAEKLNVPNDETKVAINGTSDEHYRAITVNLRSDETTATVTATAENGKEVVYTIKIIREEKPRSTTFTNYFRQYPIYVVSETGKVYYPSEYEQNKARFYLPLDRTYTYHYAYEDETGNSYVKTFKLQSAVLNDRVIPLPSLERMSIRDYID